MTEFEKAVNEKIAAARKDGEEDIRYKIVKALEGEFLSLIPSFIPPNENLHPLVAETIWVTLKSCKEDKKEYQLVFGGKEKIFKSYEEVQEFAKQIINIFPHENLDCHILNTIEWGRSDRIGSKMFGLEFSLKVN